jgi:hypothetical protein
MDTRSDTRLDTQRTQDWRFWASWGLAFLGFPLGGIAASALVGSIGSVAETALAGAATGAVVGAAQWLVLSRRLPLSPWWIVATGAGMSVGLALGTQLLGTDMGWPPVLLRALLTGAGIGLAQSLMLRDLTSRAPVWGAVVTLGWALGWVVSTAIGVDLGPWAVFGSSGALTFQLVTGLTLAWLVQRAQPSTPRLTPTR